MGIIQLNKMNNELKWTGERMVTTFVNEIGTIEHLNRYAFALNLTKNKIVLDIACGEGYGTNLLSTTAYFVYGVDISKEAVDHAKKKYLKSNIEFKFGSADKIPLENNSIDIVISYETLEHHDKHDEMMIEIKRVLKSDGLLILSTPEKLFYHEREQKNEFHVKELTKDELTNLAEKYFKHTFILEQQNIFGNLIYSKVSHKNLDFFNGDFYNINNGLILNQQYNKPYFNLILCSNINIPIITSTFFDGANLLFIENMTVNKELERTKNSTSYKIGNFIVNTFHFLSFNLLKKK